MHKNEPIMARFLFLFSFLLLIACQAQTQAITKQVSVQEAKKMISSQKNLVIIDYRTPKEIAQGKIQNALEIDYYQPNWKEKVAKMDKSKHYLVYCAVGGRSNGAASEMEKMGFKNIYNIKGGYGEWKKSK